MYKFPRIFSACKIYEEGGGGRELTFGTLWLNEESLYLKFLLSVRYIECTHILEHLFFTQKHNFKYANYQIYIQKLMNYNLHHFLHT